MGHSLPREWSRGHGVGEVPASSQSYCLICMPKLALPALVWQFTGRIWWWRLLLVWVQCPHKLIRLQRKTNDSKKITFKDGYCVPIYKRPAISSAMSLWRARDQRLKIKYLLPEPESLPSVPPQPLLPVTPQPLSLLQPLAAASLISLSPLCRWSPYLATVALFTEPSLPLCTKPSPPQP